MGAKQPTRLTYSDKAGSHRQITYLQEKILRWRLDHADKSKSECARALKCSYTAVQKTERNPACIAFVAEIRAMVKKVDALTYEEKRRILAMQARASIADFMGQDGKVMLSKDTPNHQAVAEYEVVPLKYGYRTKLKLHNPQTAIDLDNKMEKLYSENQVNINNAVIIKEVVMVRPGG